MEHKINVNYVAAKMFLQKKLGNELEVTDEEFDRWLLDGELIARSGLDFPGASISYWSERYGSKSHPPLMMLALLICL